GEPDPLAIASCPTITNLHPGNFDRTDPGLDRALGAVTVPDNTVATIGKLQFLHCGQKRPGLHLDSLRKKLPCTRSKNISQRIVDLVGLTKTENIDSLVHGVSLSLRGSGRLDTRLDTPPISIRHHPVPSLAHPLLALALAGPAAAIISLPMAL